MSFWTSHLHLVQNDTLFYSNYAKTFIYYTSCHPNPIMGFHLLYHTCRFRTNWRTFDTNTTHIGSFSVYSAHKVFQKQRKVNVYPPIWLLFAQIDIFSSFFFEFCCMFQIYSINLQPLNKNINQKSIKRIDYECSKGIRWSEKKIS